MDASDYQSGTVLSFGKSWETMQPVAFNSMMFKGAEYNYPVHEKEMLPIVALIWLEFHFLCILTIKLWKLLRCSVTSAEDKCIGWNSCLHMIVELFT